MFDEDFFEPTDPTVPEKKFLIAYLTRGVYDYIQSRGEDIPFPIDNKPVSKYEVHVLEEWLFTEKPTDRVPYPAIWALSFLFEDATGVQGLIIKFCQEKIRSMQEAREKGNISPESLITFPRL